MGRGLCIWGPFVRLWVDEALGEDMHIRECKCGVQSRRPSMFTWGQPVFCVHKCAIHTPCFPLMQNAPSLPLLCVSISGEAMPVDQAQQGKENQLQ